MTTEEKIAYIVEWIAEHTENQYFRGLEGREYVYPDGIIAFIKEEF